MIFPSLKWRRQSRRDDSNRVAPHRVSDKQQPPLAHADDRKSVFAVVLARVQPVERERVLERRARGLEGDAVMREVRGGFRVISLEMSVIHLYTA
jgi:hypothetical protein